MRDLTPSQSRVLAYIKAHIAKLQAPPTLAEISAHCGWASENAAREHLLALERKGAIELRRGVSRGIFVL